MGWSKWRDIEKEAGYNGWAIYKISMKRDNKTVPIPRFLGIDKKGLLCIGITKEFEERLKQFKRGWKTGQGHSEANLLHLLDKHTNIKKQFKNYKCHYSFKKITRNQNLDDLESQKIKDYVKKYGEVPPLNSAIRYRYEEW